MAEAGVLGRRAEGGVFAVAARRLKGETVTMSVPNDRKSFLSTLFMRRAA